MGNGEWRDAGGELTSDPASAAMPSGQTFVAGRGQDSAIWVTTCAQAQCNGWTSIGGVLTSAPSVRVSSDGTVHITGTGQDGNAWTNVFDAAQQKWSGWAAVASQEKAR
jgi:hypothetical protein